MRHVIGGEVPLPPSEVRDPLCPLPPGVTFAELILRPLEPVVSALTTSDVVKNSAILTSSNASMRSSNNGGAKK